VRFRSRSSRTPMGTSRLQLLAVRGNSCLSSLVAPCSNPFAAKSDLITLTKLPLVAHTMPWTAMLFSLAFATGFFFVAMRIVQMREY
jgi:hypothetical protein